MAHRVQSWIFAALLCFSTAAPAQTLDAFLDNGTVRVGVTRAYGGAITWLSTNGGANLVNNSDRGRQIQQSYYAGASLAATNQCRVWSPWPWNPIMVGDCEGNSSPVLVLTNLRGRLYMKAQPLLWDRSNVVSQSFIELWIGFHPTLSNVVVVDNLFTSFRDATDAWGGPAPRAQEIPACYFVSCLSTIRSYTGATPWQNAPLGTIPNVFMWTNFIPTEQWAACVNGSEFGVGIYSPDATSMNAGKFGAGVTCNTFDSSTMHIAPLVTKAFDRKSVYGYRCFLAVGQLAAIRSAFHQIHAKPPIEPAPETVTSTSHLNPTLSTLWIASDSTAARGRGEMQQGWGMPFADYFDPAKINIANRARSGRSSRTFINEGFWDQLIAELKRGDIVLLQFGHNDGGPINTPPARGSLPGLGDETQNIESISTRLPETVHTFGWYLRKMITDVKARGATPIVLSLTLRSIWDDGKIERGSGRYSQWSYEVAKSTAVPFIDLMNTQGDAFDALGESVVTSLYPQDHTHFNAEGADRHAFTVVALLKGLRPNPVAKVLSAKGQAVIADKFSWLRLSRPVNPKLPSLILIGDSTVRNGRGDGVNGQWGWGDFLDPHFDTTKLNIVNRAVGGTGARSFGAAGYWDAALALIKPGDMVMIQFGHNDNGPGGPLRGTGFVTEKRENPVTRQMEVVQSFGAYLRRYVADIRARQATPILCSLVPRKIWKDGRIVRTANSHADWTREVAAAERVAFLDLHEIIASRYDALGEAAVDALFADERVHTTKTGAELNAQCVITALRALPDNPLARFLNDWTGVAPKVRR